MASSVHSKGQNVHYSKPFDSRTLGTPKVMIASPILQVTRAVGGKLIVVHGDFARPHFLNFVTVQLVT